MADSVLTSYQLRPAVQRDAAAMQQALWPDWSIETVQEIVRRAEELTRQGRGVGMLAEFIPNTYYPNEQSREPLGYGQLTLWPRVAEISDLIVAAAYRDQGVGTAIIRTLIGQAAESGLPQAEIGVALSNPRALALYRRLGFVDSRVITMDLGKGSELVLYLTMPIIGAGTVSGRAMSNE